MLARVCAPLSKKGAYVWLFPQAVEQVIHASGGSTLVLGGFCPLSLKSLWLHDPILLFAMPELTMLNC